MHICSVYFLCMTELPGDSAELEVLINGVNNIIVRTTSCVGENVTYVCTVASVGHVWSSDAFTNPLTVIDESPDVVEITFTFRSVSLDDGTLTSSLSITSYPGLDGIMLMCSGGGDEQTATAMVFGENTHV